MVNRNYIFFSAFDKNLKNMYLADKSKFLVLSGIIFNTNFTEKYQELGKNECYFSYSVYEKKTGVAKKKLQRIIRELIEDEFIEWVYKSNTKNKESIIRLNFRHGKGYGKRYSKGYSKGYDEMLENREVEDNKDIVKDTVKDTVEDTLSKYMSRNKSILQEEETLINEFDKDILKIYQQFNLEYKYEEQRQFIRNFREEFNKEIIELAVIESAKRGKLDIAYISAVLNDWRNKGFTNREQVIINLDEWIQKNKQIKCDRENRVKEKANYNSTKRNLDKVGFNNFTPRKYDYDSLEKKLLGWDEDDSEDENKKIESDR